MHGKRLAAVLTAAAILHPSITCAARDTAGELDAFFTTLGEQYHLNGAEANTTYAVFLEMWVGDNVCSLDPDFVLGPTSSFTTNKAGNGHGKARFAAADVAGLPTLSSPGTCPTLWLR